ncbi:hypothetical protein SynA1825c_01578 [Synechococcus sp. A18-25c]|nr:hypothetical protein SynA1825c_01578 [Synechococcus sp. A18-25c]
MIKQKPKRNERHRKSPKEGPSGLKVRRAGTLPVSCSICHVKQCLKARGSF